MFCKVHIINIKKHFQVCVKVQIWVRSLGWEDSPGGGHGYTPQYFGMENSMGTVHGVEESQTRLSDFHFTSQRQMFFYFF